MAEGGQEKTEQATPQRMKKVRAEGGLSKSQDLSAWLGVGAAVVMMPMTLDRGIAAAREQLDVIRDVIASPEPALALQALSGGLGSVLVTLGPMLAAVVVAAIVANAAQGGVHIATKKLKPTFKQFNIVKGLKRTFGGQALWQGAKALLKTTVVGGVLYIAVQDLIPTLMTAGGLSISSVITVAGGGLRALLIWAVVAGIVLAVVDVLVVIKRNRKQTKMSKKEVMDEHKQSEGDPQMKGARRSRQLAASRNRMLGAVADADVVVVNPTHVAVALRYEPGKGAPRVVATGKGHVATRIREEAARHHVTMIADVPLARAIHGACKPGDEIPAELFMAVAQVLAFVMSLKRRGSGQGKFTMPRPVEVPPVPDAATRARQAREARARARAQAMAA